MAEELFKKEKNVTPDIEQVETNESPLIRWAFENKKKVSYFAVLLIAVSVLIALQLSKSSSSKLVAYEKAESLAEDLQSPDASIDREEVVNELKAISDQYPELQQKFDGLIAQEYIIDQRPQKIDPYAKRATAQLKKAGLVAFAEFSEVSSLIGKQKYPEALIQAKKLNQTLINNTSYAKEYQFALQAMNLLQLSALSQKTLNPEDAKTYLNELRSLLTKEHTDIEKETATQILALLSENNASLLDYLQNL